jgi:ABC-type dipeptide/oligopeptide/nickel transport system permease subunit
MPRRLALVFTFISLGMLLVFAFWAPDRWTVDASAGAFASPWELPPFGADAKGRPLTEYAMQGAHIVALPAILAGLLVTFLGIVGGLVRCMGSERVESAVAGLREVVGALPRMVVILVVAILMPLEWRSLMALSIVWALLAAPGAMDEAAAVAGRLGGARFVEALRAHGFSRPRIYLYHVVALNLRPVVVRQGAETLMQVVFLEVALSFLALAAGEPSFTHNEATTKSWADLLYQGYQSIAMDVSSGHALALGLALVATTAVAAVSISSAARAR